MTTGRRMPDTARGDLPSGIRRGDYWRVLDASSGRPAVSADPSNLTGGIWMVAAPMGEADGFAVGTLSLHTVREHEDGSISVRPGDGSSNSIKIIGARGQVFHGYIERGVWRSA